MIRAQSTNSSPVFDKFIDSQIFNRWIVIPLRQYKSYSTDMKCLDSQTDEEYNNMMQLYMSSMQCEHW